MISSKKYVAAFFFAASVLIPLLSIASSSDIEVRRDILKKEPEVTQPTTDKVFTGASYEFGVVDLPSGGQDWTVVTGRIAYIYNNLQLPYFQFSRYLRGSVANYTYDFGGYYKFGRCYLNLEGGFGSDVTFAYKEKALAEFSHPIVGSLYLKEKYKFLHDVSEDIHILSPGLDYYFGDHYIEAEFDAAITNDRGTAYWGALKGYFAASENVYLWLGSAVGERLYDVMGFAVPSDEFGFIVYGGLKRKIVKNLFLDITLLYGQEDPDFHHRSVTAGLSYKF